MGRKSKHASTGHFPLTNHEIKEYSKGSGHGTTTSRLSGSAQLSFGYCALSLHPAKEQAVATPSGYIYERAALLEYMLTQTEKIKQQQRTYDRWEQAQKTKEEESNEKKRKGDVERFENAQKVVSSNKKVRTIDSNPLSKASYWLSEFQPESQVDTAPPLPPKRPPSPMTQQPLRHKQLISLDLKFNSADQVICAISEKAIVHQQALALIPKQQSRSAQVVLESVYEDVKQGVECPVTSQKLSKILKLQKGGSSFAANGGVVEAKKYRPTMT